MSGFFLLLKQEVYLKYIFLFLFSLSSFANTQDQKINETVALIKSLIKTKTVSKEIKFVVGKCDINKSKWAMLLLSKQSFKESIKFKKDCDAQGDFTANIETPFPVSLKLRNLKTFTDIKFNFLINLLYSPTPMIKIKMDQGHLSGKLDKIEFTANYSVEIDPLSKEIVKKDLGGIIFIKSINGKVINKSFPFKAK